MLRVPSRTLVATSVSEWNFRSMQDFRMNDKEESPGVPGFRTWRGVYLFVFAAFVLVVIGLAILSRVYA